MLSILDTGARDGTDGEIAVDRLRQTLMVSMTEGTFVLIALIIFRIVTEYHSVFRLEEEVSP